RSRRRGDRRRARYRRRHREGDAVSRAPIARGRARRRTAGAGTAAGGTEGSAVTGLDERHDDRIRRALHDAARVPEVHDVPSGVARKRAAHHARRRAATIGVAIVLVAGIGGTLAAVIDNDRGPRVTAGPARNTGLARVANGPFGGAATGGTSVGAQPLTLDPDVGYVRGPVFASHGEVTVAAYERADNSFGF